MVKEMVKEIDGVAQGADDGGGLPRRQEMLEETDTVRSIPNDAAHADKGLRELVETRGELPNKVGDPTRLADTKVGFKGQRFVSWGAGRFPSIYISCLGHVGCAARWRLIRELGQTTIQQKGDHTSEESKENRKWLSLNLKRRIASTPGSVTQARAEIARALPEGFPVPSLREVYQFKQECKQSPSAMQETTCVEKLEPWLREKNGTDGSAIVSQRFLQLTHYTGIPFTCPYLLSVCHSFVARCVGRVHWCMDFTHDVCRQRFKLGCFALLGCHWSGGLWRSTALPLMFCIASKEVTSSALLTIQAAKEMFREKFGVELASRLGDGTLDGHPGLHEAAEVELTGLRVHRCLEHAKRNIGKHGRLWVAGNKTSMIQGMMEATAFFPSALLFHATWLRIYQRLGGIGTEGGAAEPGMTKYMQKHQVVVGSDGLLTAAWRTSLLEVQPGYAGYVQNSLESFWKVLDSLAPSPEKERDIKEVITELEKHSESWRKCERFQDAVAIPSGPDLLVPSLLRGRGLMSARAGLYKEQFRRQTVERIRMASSAGQTVAWPVPEPKNQDSGGLWWEEAWVMAKTQAHIPDLGRAMTFAGLLGAESLADLVTVASDGGGVSDGVLSYSWVRQIMGEFTLIVRQGDQLHDAHRDYVIHGVSEQWLYMMISQKRLSHTPLPGARAKPKTPRQTRTPEADASTPQPRAATRSRTPAGPSSSRTLPASLEPQDAVRTPENAGPDAPTTPTGLARSTTPQDGFDAPEQNGFDTPEHTGPRTPTRDEDSVYWLQCDRCEKWCDVPQGTMHSFEGDRRFVCSYAGHTCLPKRARRH